MAASVAVLATLGHRLFRCEFIGKPSIVFCRRCGCWTSSRKIGIAKQCSTFRQAGKKALSRIDRGLHPSRGAVFQMRGRPVACDDLSALRMKDLLVSKPTITRSLSLIQPILDRVRARNELAKQECKSVAERVIEQM